MLILTRKPGESLFIGESVKITVMEIKGNQIRIGIEAPKELRIYREEIYLQIMEENKMASDVSAAGSFGPPAFSGDGGSSGSDSGDGGEESTKDAVFPGKPIVKPVSRLNSMKGRFSSKESDLEGRNDGQKQGLFRQPEVVIRKKIKPSEEA